MTGITPRSRPPVGALLLAGATVMTSPLLATEEIIRSGSPMVVLQDRTEPDLDTIVTAPAGGVVYSESRTRGHSVAILDAEFSRGNIHLPVGSVLYGYHYTWPGERTAGLSPIKWCSHLRRQQSGPFCMIDRDGDGRMDERSVSENIFRSYLKYVVYELEEPVFRTLSRADRQVAYTKAVMPFDHTFHRGEPRWLYRQELVYQGQAQGALRFLHRDVADVAHPVAGQGRSANPTEFTVRRDDSGPTMVVFHGATIEVLDAGRERIRYRVRTGFQKEGRPGGFRPERSRGMGSRQSPPNT